MKYYLPYIKKHWYCFLLGPFFMVLEASGEFILPFLSAKIINEGAANNDVGYVLQNGVYMLLIAAGMMITGVLGANFAVRGSAHLAAGIRKETFAKIQTFSFENIDRFTPGSLITRITNDITQIQNFTQTLLRGMFRSPIMLVGALIMAFIMNRELAWIILVVVPVLALIIALIIAIAAPRYTKMQKQLDLLNTEVRETVTNERVIKSFVREEFQKEKFAPITEALAEKSTKALKMMLLLQPVSALAVNVTTLAVVWFAGEQIMVGDMEIGTLTAFITYLSQVLTALNFLANIVLQGTRAAASHKRIGEVLTAKVIPNDDHVTDRSPKVRSGKIEMQGVSFRYFKNNKEKVLDTIDLSIESGELVGIIGSTGSGKTTLISLIPRLYDCDEGAVLVDGRNVKDYPLAQLREKIAVVLQKNTLFSGTIEENLRWGNEHATKEELIDACKTACAHGFISSFPEGYDTELVQGGMNLSGGQRQRLCIARALLKKPAILILDDSTSAVDTATDASIRKAFREHLPGVTKLIIAQRINSVKDADHIAVLDHGQLVGFGKHQELMQNCKEYREIYYSQKDKEE